jgi:hypothetical protein
MYLMLLESSHWLRFNEVYFIIFRLKVRKMLNFLWILVLKIQTNYQKRFRRENELNVFTLGANNTSYVVYPWKKLVCFVLSRHNDIYQNMVFWVMIWNLSLESSQWVGVHPIGLKCLKLWLEAIDYSANFSLKNQ